MKRLPIAAVVGVALGIAFCGGEDERPLRFATFNIEDFPRDGRQIDGAFRTLSGLHADIVALQEITDPDRFAVAARARLGETWGFVHSGQTPNGRRYPRHRTGVLFDGARYRLGRVKAHDDTRDAGGPQPVLDVELEPRGGGLPVRVFVVHLRCCSDGRPGRAREHEALRRLLADVGRGEARVLVAGDFNATAEEDRTDLGRLAAQARLDWATADLGCSAFWQRDDGCPTSRLDHVLTSQRPRSVAAAGGCADGCEARDRCPRYVADVSDHCPVVVELSATP